MTGAVAAGRIIKHTQKFRPSINSPYWAAELSLSRQVNGSKPWHWRYRYPSLGLTASAACLGNDSVLGNAYAAFPFLELPLAGWPNGSLRPSGLSLTFRFGSGLAWLSRWYDPETNPLNNVIPGRINNITRFELAANYRFRRQFSLSAAAILTHYSAGAVRVPNLGLNIPAARLSVSWQPVPFAEADFQKINHSTPPHRWTGNLQVALGFQEFYPAGGPMYHLVAAEVSGGRWLGEKNILSAGLLAHFKESSWTFIRQHETYPNQHWLRSLAVAPFLRNDLVVGNIGVALTMGYFVYAPAPQQIRLFQRIGWYYSFPLGKNEYVNRLSCGVYLTAGSFSADYVSVEIGWRF